MREAVGKVDHAIGDSNDERGLLAAQRWHEGRLLRYMDLCPAIGMQVTFRRHALARAGLPVSSVGTVCT